jgi:hypothetical protein
MIKPGSAERKRYILINGLELIELHRFDWLMAESYGLDRRIANYKGTRPIGLWRWDIDCLVDTIDLVLDDPEFYSSHETPGYLAIKTLQDRLKEEGKALNWEIRKGR